GREARRAPRWSELPRWRVVLRFHGPVRATPARGGPAMTSACQRWCWSILLLATLACARDRGQGFATLEDAQLEISLEARGDSDDAELSTDRGYTIALDHATVRVGRWELLEFAKRPSETDGHEHDDEEHDHGLDEDEHEHEAR